MRYWCFYVIRKEIELCITWVKRAAVKIDMNFKTYMPQCKILNRIHSMALTKWCKFSIDSASRSVDLNILSFRVKRNELRVLICLFKQKTARAIKYQSPDFPWYDTRDVRRPWFFLTYRNERITNMALPDTSQFLTRHVPDLENFTAT